MKTPDAFDGEQLLSGSLDPDDAPQELKELAGLIRAAKTPVHGASPIVDQAFIAMIADGVRRSAEFEPAISASHLHRIYRFPSGRVAAATTALMLTGGLAAAAATGSLPVPVQRVVSDGLAHVGISVPDPKIPHTPSATGVTTTTVRPGTAKPKSTTGAVGLCNAYLHQSGAHGLGTTQNTFASSEGARLLQIASSHNESVLAYCQGLGLHVGPGVPSESATTPTKTPSHSPTTPKGSSASTKAQHSSISHHGANTSRSPNTGATTKAQRSKATVTAAGGPNSHRAISPMPSKSSKSVGTNVLATTTSSLPTVSGPGTTAAGAPASKNVGKGVSAAQTTS